MKRSEILANREKVIAFLMEPERKKAVGLLDKGEGQRCCLGHMAYALDIKNVLSAIEIFYGKEQESTVAPKELIELVGLYDPNGSFEFSTFEKPLSSLPICFNGNSNLAAVNDDTDATPQQIGEWLRTVINGGNGTPWLPLASYSDFD